MGGRSSDRPEEHGGGGVGRGVCCLRLASSGPRVPTYRLTPLTGNPQGRGQGGCLLSVPPLSAPNTGECWCLKRESGPQSGSCHK